MELEDLEIEIDDAFINEDWFRRPVSDLNKDGVKTLKMAIRTVKEEKYKRRWENREVDEDWGPTDETYQAIEKAYDRDVGLDNPKLEDMMRETLGGRIEDLSRRELEVLRQELVGQINITWGDISRREFLVDVASLGALSLIAGGVIYGGYKAYQSNREFINGLLFPKAGGEGPLTFLDREFDSAAGYVEFMAGIDYPKLTSQEQNLVKGLSYVWSREAFDSPKSRLESLTLDSEAEDLFNEMMDTIRYGGDVTPAYMLNQPKEYIYEYNAAKVMAIELGNDLYQEDEIESFEQAGEWLIEGLQDEISRDDLENPSVADNELEEINCYLIENYGGEPGLMLLEDTFEDFKTHV